MRSLLLSPLLMLTVDAGFLAYVVGAQLWHNDEKARQHLTAVVLLIVHVLALIALGFAFSLAGGTP